MSFPDFSKNPEPKLRPATDEDQPDLIEVYASTRIEEIALVGWNEAHQLVFFTMQFQAQHHFYRMQYPAAEHSVIELAGKTIGRLIVVRQESEIRLADIALLPEYRNQGIGAHITYQLIAEATTTNKPLRLQVLKHSPAVRFYQRLGFRETGSTDTHFQMEYRRIENEEYD
ncbi:MAG: GNAT family N-acetyltransferase [Acidobacteria bacterium]|nr:GNAT family N-acetyltransferase [Acidobacteriota bacterium]